MERLLAEAASHYVTDAEASYFAKCYMDSHLKKYPRMNPFQDAVADLKVWKDSQNRSVETLVSTAGAVVMDLNGLAPSLQIKAIHDELETRAGKTGVAIVGFRNSSGIVTLNMWADGLARRDLIGIAMFNGGTQCCVPFGGRTGVFGTNPLAYAIPTETDPVALDMAGTEIPFFEVKDCKEKGLPLKAGVAVDPDGRPTVDAALALTEDGVANLLPMGGGFKGYGIVFLIEILTGPLVRSLLSTEQTPGWNPNECGCLVAAIDISSFTDLSLFKKSVSSMCTTLRGMPAGDGFEGITIPGDRGYASREMLLEAGQMDVDKKLVEALKTIGDTS
jgi:LDH2 family malate/lactate/ureidoglycolate dehydrogenase